MTLISPSKYCLQNGTVGRRQTIIASVLSCFGGGVLLATTMLHMLPEVGEGLAEEAEKLELEFLAQLVLCSGFFLIYVVEELAETLLGGHGHGNSELQRTMSVRRTSRTSSQADPHNDMEKPSYGSMNKGAELSQSETTIRSTAESPDPLVSSSTETPSSLRDFFTSKNFLHIKFS